jgi:PAS domain S-box-containing protein
VEKMELKSYLKDLEMYKDMMEVMDGLMIIVYSKGKILLVKKKVEKVMGNKKKLLMGKKLK